MNFKEHLDFIKNAGEDFFVGKLAIANEVDCQVEFDLTADQFEKVCEYAYEYYLDSTLAGVDDIVRGVLQFIRKSDDKQKAIDSLSENEQEISDIIYC